MSVQDDVQKLGKMAKKYLAPMVMGGADIYIANLFDAFLEEKEGDIRRALGVHHTYPIVKPLKRLFRDFIEDRNLGPAAPPKTTPSPAPGIPREPVQRTRVNTVFDDDMEEGFDEEEPIRRRQNPWD